MRILVALAAAASLSACMSVSYGVKPHTERLQQLKPGQTRSSDVLLTLGEPRGKGAAHVRPEMPLEEVWFYEFVKSDGSKTDLDMLLVFMKGDIYDGYLWFSSLQKMKKS